MQYKKISDTRTVVDHLSTSLSEHLAKSERVLWLIPGGSAIAIAAKVSRRLSGIDLTNLHVTLTDERFGAVGHGDSNWQQLIDSGFALPGAQLMPVLRGVDIDETTRVFAKYLETQLASAQFSIGLFGMGADGHTAGILPGSSAVSDPELAVHYQTPNYNRVTMTPQAIVMLDEAVLYATGPEKAETLDYLAKDLSLSKQPAQILKKISTLTVYNDYREDKPQL